MTPDSETPHAASHWPVAVLAVLGVFFMLYWARGLHPVTLGVPISYALSPLVDRLHG